MVENLKNYVVASNAGEGEKVRLKLQNELFAPGTQAFLTPFLNPTMTALVIGCGTGEDTCFIAQSIGPRGKVVAIDIDENQLEQARIQLAEKDITNVELRQMNLMDITTLPGSFDLIYTRLVLMHITNCSAALKIIYNTLKPGGGRLACEEPVISTICAAPSSAALNRHIELLALYGQSIDTDFNIGNRLKHLFKQSGLKQVTETTSQALLTTRNQKRIVTLSAAACAPAYYKKKLSTPAEMKELIEQLDKTVVSNDACTAQQPKLHQVTGLRPK